MKLKYYMRGLGIGIGVTALIFILSGNTGKSMTDEEIKKRAAQLGMVENTKEVLADLEAEKSEVPETETVENESIQAENAENDKEKVENPETENVETENVETENAGIEKTEIGNAETEKQKTEVTGTEGSKTEPENMQEELSEEEQKKREVEALKEAAEEVAQKAQNLNPNGVVTILVQGGDSSVTVAKRVETAGLVESAAEFDRFLCQNGYDKSICVGSYEVPVGATPEEIAKIITRKQ